MPPPKKHMARIERKIKMKKELRTPLTLTESCTLLARETVSMLEGDDAVSPSVTGMRNTLALISSQEDLGDGGVLLAWVDHEMEAVRRFAEAGELAPSLVDLPAPLPLPDPAMQLDMVWAVLQATGRSGCTREQWLDALDAVRTITEMDDLEDRLLDTFIPNGGFLTTEDLRDELEQVRAAVRNRGLVPTGSAPKLEQG